uniref:RGS domain-containing protein n=1 Tax=Mesocestoides corti TaxID=53468 RepID=A0A5K3FWI5_MESCO
MTSGSSRLSPPFESVIKDPLLLSYFTRYLHDISSDCIFRFWLELSGCINRSTCDESYQFESKGGVLSGEELKNLRDKISQLPVNDVTTIYFRYISSEAKIPVELPMELLSESLLRILENPGNIFALAPCLQFAESKLRNNLFPDFLKSQAFTNFCAEIVMNDQLTLDDVLFDETLLVYFVEVRGRRMNFLSLASREITFL